MITIALHQLREMAGSSRFQACVAILLTFFALNGVVYGWRFEALQDEVSRLQAGSEERYDGVDSVADAAGQWFRVLNRPLGTEFMCEGGTRWFNDSGWVTAQTGESPGTGKQITTNNWMVRFELVDWAFIVQVVVSFLCILLAYDSISGEREQGTLKLILANPVSRARVLAGKAIAYLAAVMAAVVAGSLLSLVLLTMGGPVALDGRLVGTYALFLVATGLYCVAVLLGCIGASSLLRRSGTVLLALVFAWAVLTIIVPQAACLVGSSTGISLADVWDQEEELQEQTQVALAAEGLKPRGRETGGLDGYQVEKQYLQRMWALDREVSQLSRAGHEGEVRQYETTRALARLSPGYAFRGTLEACLGTGSERYAYFLKRVWEYRDTLRAFLRGRDAADRESPHLTFLPGYLSRAPLDSRQIPRFADKRLPLADSISSGVVPMVVLALEAVGALLFAVWAFNRTEA